LPLSIRIHAQRSSKRRKLKDSDGEVEVGSNSSESSDVSQATDKNDDEASEDIVVNAVSSGTPGSSGLMASKVRFVHFGFKLCSPPPDPL
jgi:hypothetical protein